MSGFKSWNNSSSSFQSSSGGSSGGGTSGGGSSGGGGSSVTQWNETPALLFTNKAVETTSIMIARAFSRSSDIKLKNNISNLSNNKNEHLDKIKKLIPKSYNLKENNQYSFGLIAQEVEKIYPHMVHTGADGYKSIDYEELIPLLLLQTNNLERKIEELKNNN